uniref:Fucosyltransferase n=1 Tax=Anthurium amnicola TaxID=1678845 RepID=A0A1D1XU91_9ARAE
MRGGAPDPVREEMNGGGRGGSEHGEVGNPGPPVHRWVWVVVSCMALPTLVFVSGVHRLPVAVVPYLSGDVQSQRHVSEDGGRLREASQRRQRVARNGPQEDGELAPPRVASDPLPRDSLAAGGFDSESCLSRQEISLYRDKPPPWEPSSHLLQRLREYEARHKLCAPNTELYNETLSLLLRPGRPTTSGDPPPACKYLVWSPRDGLGNRMLSLASTFAYALLTRRVLLIDRSKDMADLFCEPFPETTWLLPPDHPLAPFYVFDKSYPQRYGKVLIGNKKRIPAFVYLHLAHDYTDDDKRFFCDPSGEEEEEEGSSPLHAIPWVVVRSNQYFIPALFLNPAFENELHRLFPEKEAVFHLLSRYLFHPTNAVWGLITRYYRAYLAMAEEKVGIQIRVFDNRAAPFDVVLKQILNCTLREKLLPEVTSTTRRPGVVSSGAGERTPTKSVLLTSLSSGYFERIKDMYWEHPAAGGGVVVRVHQPSHEEWQQTDSGGHDRKALAEMYLLGLSDALVTTAGSTFGYVAQALAGVRPRVMAAPAGGGVPEPACVRAASAEPCFQYPPSYDCRAGRRGDLGKVAPYVRHCEDVNWGLQLVERSQG